MSLVHSYQLASMVETWACYQTCQPRSVPTLRIPLEITVFSWLILVCQWHVFNKQTRLQETCSKSIRPEKSCTFGWSNVAMENAPWRFIAGKHIELNGDFRASHVWLLEGKCSNEVSIPWFFQSQARPSSRVPKIRQQWFFFCPALHMFSSAKGFFEFLVGGFSPPLIIQFLFLKKFIVKPPARCCWVHPQLRALNTWCCCAQSMAQQP